MVVLQAEQSYLSKISAHLSIHVRVSFVKTPLTMRLLRLLEQNSTSSSRLEGADCVTFRF